MPVPGETRSYASQEIHLRRRSALPRPRLKHDLLPVFRQPNQTFSLLTRSITKPTDHRKLRPRLLTSWPTIPIEVEPLATPRVLRILHTLGSPSPTVRSNPLAKAGPIKTDQDNFIVDAPFPTLLTQTDVEQGDNGDGKGEGGMWEVEALAREIKLIQGVLEVGLFVGRNGVEVQRDGDEGGGQRPVAAYFGMEDGRVEVRRAKERS